ALSRTPPRGIALVLLGRVRHPRRRRSVRRPRQRAGPRSEGERRPARGFRGGGARPRARDSAPGRAPCGRPREHERNAREWLAHYIHSGEARGSRYAGGPIRFRGDRDRTSMVSWVMALAVRRAPEPPLDEPCEIALSLLEARGP